MKKVLSNNENKMISRKFICNSIRENLQNCSAMATNGEKVHLAGELEQSCWFYWQNIYLDYRWHIRIHILSEKTRTSVILALQAAHVLTGCDTTSSDILLHWKRSMGLIKKKMSDEDLKNFANLREHDFDCTRT